MGIDTTNIERLRHSQPATGLREWVVRLHYQLGGVDSAAPPISQTSELGLRAVAGIPSQFAAVASATWGGWWASLPGLVVPLGSAPWQELVRQDYTQGM